ncbi:MAG: HEAT repeat domain-containing protein [Planctomycetes bacterium]|nr:HEAT repeat domain-containing protein [Planctomycetota bacterium]
MQLTRQPVRRIQLPFLLVLAGCAGPGKNDAPPDRHFEIETTRATTTTNQLVVDLDALVSNWLALYATPPPDDPVKVARHEDSMRTARRKIEELLTSREDELVDIVMNGASQTQREQVARALGFASSERAREVLLALLEGGRTKPSLTQRLMFGLGLGARAETPLAPFLTYLTPEHHQALRETAAWAVLRVALAGGGSSTEGILLAESLRDASPSVRRQVARALAEPSIANPTATDRIVELVGDEVQSVRVAAIEAIGLLEHLPAARKIVPLLSHEDSLTRDRSRWALRRLFGRDLGASPDSWWPLVDAAERRGGTP